MIHMKTEYILIGIAIIALVIFFWPKENSRYTSLTIGELQGLTSFQNFVCTCIGISTSPTDCKSCTQYTDCYGIPISCKSSCFKKINEVWREVSCDTMNDIRVTANDIPTNQKDCEARGGQWGPLGLSPNPVCLLPTTDGGKICTDSSQCEAGCVANLTPEQYDQVVRRRLPVSTTGICMYWRTSIGCHAYVENGVVSQILCVD